MIQRVSRVVTLRLRESIRIAPRLLAALAWLIGSVTLPAQNYVITDLGPTSPSSRLSLNNAGQVVHDGYIYLPGKPLINLTGQFVFYATLNNSGLTAGQLVGTATGFYNINTPAFFPLNAIGWSIIPTLVNDRGWVAGYGMRNNQSTAVFFSPGVGVVDLSPMQIAAAMNTNGVVVGAGFDAASILHGYTSQIVTSPFNVQPGGTTIPNAINDAGQIVGEAFTDPTRNSCSPPNVCYGFVYTPNKPLVNLNLLTGTVLSSANGINKLGQVVGAMGDVGAANTHAFLYDPANGKVVDLNNLVPTLKQPQVRVLLGAGAINDFGQITTLAVTNTGYEAFLLTPTVSMVDPVPDLIDRTGSLLNLTPFTKVASDLATKGRMVQGVAADGVVRVILRIAAANPVTLTVLHDSETPSTSADDDGQIAGIGTDTYSGSVTVNPMMDTGGASMAFAIYQAPLNFVRSDSNYSASDAAASSRTVTVRIHSSDGTFQDDFSITIVRPPVVLVHGFVSEAKYWDQFEPLLSDPRFYIQRADYSRIVPNVSAISVPGITDTVSGQAAALLVTSGKRPVRANQLGLDFNAPDVFKQFEKFLQDFRMNSMQAGSAPVAASQVDVVAHSMGGLVTRNMPFAAPDFYGEDNYLQGAVHKLITIGTPHLGSPHATAALAPSNFCTWLGQVARDEVPITTALVAGKAVVGGTFDLQGQGLGGPTDCVGVGILNLQKAPPRSMRVSVIAGEMSDLQLDALDGSVQGKVIASLRATSACSSDYVIQNYTSARWSQLMGTTLHDAIVPLVSAIDNFAVSDKPVTIFQGYIHGPGTLQVGFPGPHLQQQVPGVDGVPDRVIQLLNTSVMDPAFAVLPLYPDLGQCK